MTEKEFQEKLERYKLNTCTPEEKSWIESWYAYYAGKQEEFSVKIELDGVKSKTWDSIQLNVGDATRKSKFTAIKKWTIAASLVLIVSAGFMFYRYSNEIKDYLDPVKMTYSATAKGKMMQVVLSDGTSVWLNEGSKLKYPQKFNRNERIVELTEGEAYFDVVHNQKPFIVLSKGVRTQVLGTAFNIRSYTFLKNLQVTVSRGKVAVSQKQSQGNKMQQVMLLPNERVSIDSENGKFNKDSVSAESLSNWNGGYFGFSNESLENVVKLLEYRYNIQMALQNESLKEYHITGSFKSSEKLENVLNDICLIKGLKYHYDEGQIVISKKK